MQHEPQLKSDLRKAGCWPSLRVTTTEDLCVTEGEYEQSGPCAAAW